MSSWLWIVEWKSKQGYIREEFTTKEDAQNFIQYNQWEKGEHPTIKEIELVR